MKLENKLIFNFREFLVNSTSHLNVAGVTYNDDFWDIFSEETFISLVLLPYFEQKNIELEKNIRDVYEYGTCPITENGPQKGFIFEVASGVEVLVETQTSKKTEDAYDESITNWGEIKLEESKRFVFTEFSHLSMAGEKKINPKKFNFVTGYSLDEVGRISQELEVLYVPYNLCKVVAFVK